MSPRRHPVSSQDARELLDSTEECRRCHSEVPYGTLDNDYLCLHCR
jgi:hypothetical protein